MPDCPPEKLFDRFYRGDSARTQKGGGYGIGLSAARSIAEIHGGSIKANYGNEYVEYIGIAADESKRIERHAAKRLILVELGMTELDCLNYCHQKGFNWYEGEYELYDHLDRVSCWCCRNKNLKEISSS